MNSALVNKGDNTNDHSKIIRFLYTIEVATLLIELFKVSS